VFGCVRSSDHARVAIDRAPPARLVEDPLDDVGPPRRRRRAVPLVERLAYTGQPIVVETRTALERESSECPEHGSPRPVLRLCLDPREGSCEDRSRDLVRTSEVDAEAATRIPGMDEHLAAAHCEISLGVGHASAVIRQRARR